MREQVWAVGVVVALVVAFLLLAFVMGSVAWLLMNL